MPVSITDYTSRIAPEHADKPKFTAMVAACVQPIVDLTNFIETIPSYFDVDYAIGVQLDTVGLWVGEKRQLPIPLQDFWFSWGNTRKGWGLGVWKQAGVEISQVGITVLDDDTFRSLIKAKIAANYWDGTVAGGQPALDAFFANSGTLSFIQDRQDLTMVIGVAGESPSLIKVALLGGGYIRLKPMAISTSYWFTSVNKAPLFGWGMQNGYVSGWGSGAWGVTSDYIVAQGAPEIHRCDFSTKTNAGLLVALGMV